MVELFETYTLMVLPYFFICLYIHTRRGIYFNSFLLIKTWSIGVIILLLIIITAFIGYVLPWGQMSFWGATVITNLLSAIPYLGKLLVEWLWGGFAVDNATLNRFFCIPLHFTICGSCHSYNSPFAASWNWFKKPLRAKLQFR